MESFYLPLRCKIVRIGEPTLPEFGISRHPVDTPAKSVEFWESIIVSSDDYQEDKEHLVVVCLNARLKPTGYHLVALGGLNECLAGPREIFRAAIAAAAYGFLLIHNHPSGDPTPSEADRRLTNRLKDAAEMLSIRFVDHVVVGQAAADQPGYFSFKEHGTL